MHYLSFLRPSLLCLRLRLLPTASVSSTASADNVVKETVFDKCRRETHPC